MAERKISADEGYTAVGFSDAMSIVIHAMSDVSDGASAADRLLPRCLVLVTRLQVHLVHARSSFGSGQRPPGSPVSSHPLTKELPVI